MAQIAKRGSSQRVVRWSERSLSAPSMQWSARMEFRRMIPRCVVCACACEEHLPHAFEPPPVAEIPETPIGLDKRPVTAACKAAAKPAAASNTLIGFQKVTKATFMNPVELVTHDGKMYVLEQGG